MARFAGKHIPRQNRPDQGDRQNKRESGNIFLFHDAPPEGKHIIYKMLVGQKKALPGRRVCFKEEEDSAIRKHIPL
jgi:hypothetical protein